MAKYRLIKKIYFDREGNESGYRYFIQERSFWGNWLIYPDDGYFANGWKDIKDAKYRLDILTGRIVDSQIQIIEER
jgi:hypothetical protein